MVPKSSVSFSVSCLCGTAYFAVGNGDGVLEEAPEGSDEWFVSGSILPVIGPFYFMSPFVKFPLLHSSLF